MLCYTIFDVCVQCSECVLFLRFRYLCQSMAWQRLSISVTAKCSMKWSCNKIWLAAVSLPRCKCNVIKNFQNTLKCSQAINLSHGRAPSHYNPLHVKCEYNSKPLWIRMFVCIWFVRSFAKLKPQTDVQCVYLCQQLLQFSPYTPLNRIRRSGSDKEFSPNEVAKKCVCIAKVLVLHWLLSYIFGSCSWMDGVVQQWVHKIKSPTEKTGE